MHTWSQGKAFMALGMGLKIYQSFPGHPSVEERFLGWLQCRSRNETSRGRGQGVPVLGTAHAEQYHESQQQGIKCACCTRELRVPCVPPVTPADTFALSGALPALEGKFELHKNQLL